MRVAIVSEIRLYREGLEIALSRVNNMELVGVFSAMEIISLTVENFNPEVLLVDVSPANSLSKIKRFIRRFPGIKVIGLTVAEDEQYIISCAEAGLAGYVCRDDSFEDLIKAIQLSCRGGLHCSPEHAGCLLRRVAELSAEDHKAETFQGLTPREQCILELIGKGLTNKAIANELSIQIPTVKNHVHSILGKLNVNHRGEAAALAR
ncbi:MAG: response regulator transcription factor [Gammaproteobacteria bacterium]|nr:response regulator transcription factor [Gammaproteobacteria bacterium]